MSWLRTYSLMVVETRLDEGNDIRRGKLFMNCACRESDAL